MKTENLKIIHQAVADLKQIHLNLEIIIAEEFIEDVDGIKVLEIDQSCDLIQESIAQLVSVPGFWPFKSEKVVGDKVTITEDQGDGTGVIIMIAEKDGDMTGLVKFDENHYDWFTMEYLNSL